MRHGILHMPWTQGLKPKFKCCIVGLYISHRMEMYVDVSCMNYRIVGLEGVNRKHVGAFNVHWKEWKPCLGHGSTNRFGHLQLGCLPFSPTQYGECDFHGNDRHDNVWFRNTVSYCSLFNVSYFSSLLLHYGCRLQGWRGEAWFVAQNASRGKIHTFIVILLKKIHFLPFGFVVNTMFH